MKKMLKLGLGAAIAGAAFAGMVAVPASAAETEGLSGPLSIYTEDGFWVNYTTGSSAYSGSGSNPEPTFTFPAMGATGPVIDEKGTCATAVAGNHVLPRTCDGSASQQWSWDAAGVTAPNGENQTLVTTYNGSPAWMTASSNLDWTPNRTAGGQWNAEPINTSKLSPIVADIAPVDITDATITENVATAIHGKGEPGSTITVSDANGEIGKAVVDANGDWTVPSNITESTTVTATDGITDDTYEIHIADVPLIAAPVALGALALGGVGFGGVMLRRRQKAGANA